jgi:hypothetical protein
LLALPFSVSGILLSLLLNNFCVVIVLINEGAGLNHQGLALGWFCSCGKEVYQHSETISKPNLYILLCFVGMMMLMGSRCEPQM